MELPEPNRAGTMLAAMIGSPAATAQRLATASAAAAAAALAALTFLTVTTRGVPGVVSFDPGALTTLEHVLGLVLGGALLVLARGLWRGTRRAALLAAAGLAAAAAAAVGQGHAALAVVELSSACGLVLARRAFPRGAARGGALLPAVLAGTAGIAAWATAAAALLFADRVTGSRQAASAAGGWLLDGGWWLRSDAALPLVLDGLVLVALVGGGLLLRALLRPGIGREGHVAADHDRGAAIVAEHSRDSLDPFALREDKAFHFSHGGMLAYRTVGGTAVVSGDPIGPAGRMPDILRTFAAEAQARGWDVALTGASPRHLDGYRNAGFQTLCIGEEAVVDPATFTLEGRKMRTVRQSVTRQARLGWVVEVLGGDELTPGTVSELAAVEQEWRAAQARLTGFAMTLGRLWGAPEDARSVYVIGRDPEGRACAFVRFAEYRDGLSLDVMRRVGETPNGLTEALVAAAIGHAGERGLRAVSLNFAGFGHLLGDGEAPSVAARALRWALAHAHGRFQLERLIMFNQKFGPRWEPRYLVHQSRLTLPVTGLRVLQAEAYVRSPRRRRLTARWEPRGRPVGGPAPTPPPAP